LSATRALITGAGGQLGSDLCSLLAPSSEVLAASHEELDVTDDAAVAAALGDFSPSLVINCAAFHNVEQCEREEDRSFEVNARAVKRLAKACSQTGAKLVHFSTNYVFDGTSETAYAEDDRPSPRSIYAISKLAGEHAALAYSDGALVVRTSALYGLHGSKSKGGNFVTRMVERAHDQGKLAMVADQRLTPTFTADLAEAVLEAIEAGADGLLHVTNSGACSWYDFTRAIMEVAGISVAVEPVETRSGPDEPQRPLNGVLRSSKAAALGLAPLRHWRKALADYIRLAGLGQGATAGSYGS
jgi:dTDP-4-dehydrorhamnose reductase